MGFEEPAAIECWVLRLYCKAKRRKSESNKDIEDFVRDWFVQTRKAKKAGN